MHDPQISNQIDAADACSAVDMVDHEIPLRRHGVSFGLTSLQLLFGFALDPTQMAISSDSRSSWVPIPQCSVLNPHRYIRFSVLLLNI